MNTEQFFSRNPTLLGFDEENALYQSTKELLDNAIDAVMLSGLPDGTISCSISVLRVIPSHPTCVTANQYGQSTLQPPLDQHKFLEYTIDAHSRFSSDIWTDTPHNVLVEVCVHDTGGGFSNLQLLSTSLFQTTKSSNSGTIGQFGIGLKAILLHASQSGHILPPILYISTQTKNLSDGSGPPDSIDCSSSPDGPQIGDKYNNGPYYTTQRLTLTAHKGVILQLPGDFIPSTLHPAFSSPHDTSSPVNTNDTSNHTGSHIVLRMLTSLQGLAVCKTRLTRLASALKLVNLPIRITVTMECSPMKSPQVSPSCMPSQLIDDETNSTTYDATTEHSQSNLSANPSSTYHEDILPLRTALTHQGYLSLLSTTFSKQYGVYHNSYVQNSNVHMESPFYNLYSQLLHHHSTNCLDLSTIPFVHGVDMTYLRIIPPIGKLKFNQDRGVMASSELLYHNHQPRYHTPINPITTGFPFITQYSSEIFQMLDSLPLTSLQSSSPPHTSHKILPVDDIAHGSNDEDHSITRIPAINTAPMFYQASPSTILSRSSSHISTKQAIISPSSSSPPHADASPNPQQGLLLQLVYNSITPMPWVSRLIDGLYSHILHCDNVIIGPSSTIHIMSGDLILGDHSLAPITYPNKKRLRKSSKTNTTAINKSITPSSPPSHTPTTTTTTTAINSADDLTTTRLTPSQFSTSRPLSTQSTIHKYSDPSSEFSNFTAFPHIHRCMNTLPALSSSSVQCILGVHTSTEYDESITRVPFRVACIVNSTHILSLNPDSEPLQSILHSKVLSHLGLSFIDHPSMANGESSFGVAPSSVDIGHESPSLINTMPSSSSSSSSSSTIGFSTLETTPWLQTWLERPSMIDDLVADENDGSLAEKNPIALALSKHTTSQDEPSKQADVLHNTSYSSSRTSNHVASVYLLVNLSIQSTSTLFKSLDKSSLFVSSSTRQAIIHCFHSIVTQLANHHVSFVSPTESNRKAITHQIIPGIAATLSSIVTSGSPTLKDRVRALNMSPDHHGLSAEFTKMLHLVLFATNASDDQSNHFKCTICCAGGSQHRLHRLWVRRDVQCDCHVKSIHCQSDPSVPTSIGDSLACVCLCHHPQVIAQWNRRWFLKLSTLYPDLALILLPNLVNKSHNDSSSPSATGPSSSDGSSITITVSHKSSPTFNMPKSQAMDQLHGDLCIKENSSQVKTTQTANLTPSHFTKIGDGAMATKSSSSPPVTIIPQRTNSHPGQCSGEGTMSDGDRTPLNVLDTQPVSPPLSSPKRQPTLCLSNATDNKPNWTSNPISARRLQRLQSKSAGSLSKPVKLAFNLEEVLKKE